MIKSTKNSFTAKMEGTSGDDEEGLYREFRTMSMVLKKDKNGNQIVYFTGKPKETFTRCK